MPNMPGRDTEDPLTETPTLPETCHKILRQLAVNNDREWFAAHRDDWTLDAFGGAGICEEFSNSV
jgi:hypothetical protein